MSFIIDPTNENVALDQDGKLMGSVRMLPLNDNEPPPTIQELSNAPIIGYAGPDAITYAEEAPDT